MSIGLMPVSQDVVLINKIYYYCKNIEFIACRWFMSIGLNQYLKECYYGLYQSFSVCFYDLKSFVCFSSSLFILLLFL